MVLLFRMHNLLSFYTHTHMHAYAYAYTHTHTHTYENYITIKIMSMSVIPKSFPFPLDNTSLLPFPTLTLLFLGVHDLKAKIGTV